WTGGGIAGGGTLTVGASANLLLSPGDDRALYGGATLNNNGTALATLANTLVFSSSATFNNNGLFILQSDFNFLYDNGGSRPSFNNNVGGTIRRNTSTGEVKFLGDYGGILFQNSGTLDLQSGALRLDSLATINSTSSIKFALKGTAPGTEAPQLNFGGGITFNGALSVALTNNYSPLLGATYVLMNHAGSTGTFTTPALPSLNNNLAWKASYTGTQLILKVVQTYSLTTPAKQGDGTYAISFSGPAAASIQFQVSTDLVSWETIQSVDNFSGTQAFIDADAQQYQKRFYRILIIP
ncbi:MAG: hypothetical protein K0Q55_3931, partial [Verrucomicrobia bacterium]|nr:hypothetical protein [Verrucomicrobiota bacterium]